MGEKSNYGYTVSFTDVGSSRRSWNRVYLQQPGECQLVRDVRKSGALMSRGIECEISDDGTHGYIVVGFGRAVGKFTITPNTKEDVERMMASKSTPSHE